MFVDRVKIYVEGGSGGDGCVSFRREKYIPRGGPDGGNGGNGGHVIIRAEAGVDSLAGLSHKRHWAAPAGGNGGSANRTGRNAEDLVIMVPPGTIVMDAEQGFVLKDLAAPGDQVIAGRGGRNGRGNLSFKSNVNRAPRDSTPGGVGEKRHVLLELKVIADVGLVGKPNAGKSTLLSRLSRARPEIADYPFTTKFPNLGIVQINFDRSFVMADIPGLIEGAHAGVGLGHEFLRHIERAGILIHLVEPEPTDGTDPLTNYRAVRAELEQYDVQLATRPEILVVTKSELPETESVRDQLAAETNGPVLCISAVTGQGLDRLLAAIIQELDRRNLVPAATQA
ncbi:MAG: GTPase ObgE [Planctomycetia bacterium]|nr:GTPase ObgE [Planctomycetia bacterium]